MKTAVLTLTRDRLDYTKHCFAALHENAGCDFTHYVLDQGSQDDTPDWLSTQWAKRRALVLHEKTNLGIAAALNRILDEIALSGRTYDVIAKIDNDCELVDPNTLLRCARFAHAKNAIVSPRILGLNHPPQPTGETVEWEPGTYGPGYVELLRCYPNIGGAFMAVPASFYQDWRYPTDLPAWGGDDTLISQRAQSLGMPVGYLEGLEAWHYKTTQGQHADYPWYFERREDEGGPP